MAAGALLHPLLCCGGGGSRTRNEAMEKRPRLMEVNVARGKDQDSLGTAAEDWVGTRLTRAGVLCMRPMHDRAGYDLTCHFPAAGHEPSSETAWESQGLRASLPYQSDFSVLLQVKASESLTKNPPRVKLDNLRRFVEWPNPAFFLVLEYAKGDEEPRGGYLLHFDKQRVTATLEHLWKLDDKSGQTLHKTRLSLTWAESERLPALTGQAIRAAIESSIGSDPAAYERRKRRWRDEAGKEVVRGSITTRAPSEGRHAFELMVDFSLGLTDRLPSALKKMEEVRFGLARPITLPPPKEVYLTADLKPKPAILELTSVERNDIAPANAEGTPAFARISGHFYHPRSVFPFIPDEYLRYRIATEHLDFTFRTSEGGGQLNFRFRPPDTAKAVRLSGLAEAADVLLFVDACMRSSREFSMRIQSDDPKIDMVMRLHVSSFLQPATVLELARAASNAWALARAAGVSPEVKVTTVGLDAFSSSLRSARMVLEASAGGAKSVGFDVDVEALPGATTTVGMRWKEICRLGDSEWVVMVGAIVYGPWTAQASKGPGKWRLHVARATCERIILRCARLKDIDANAWAKEAMEMGLKHLAEKGIEAIVDKESDEAETIHVLDT